MNKLDASPSWTPMCILLCVQSKQFSFLSYASLVLLYQNCRLSVNPLRSLEPPAAGPGELGVMPTVLLPGRLRAVGDGRPPPPLVDSERE